MKIKISDYFIAADYEKSSLERIVNDMIKEGYIPFGGIAITYSPNFNNNPKGVIFYSQAMVKYDHWFLLKNEHERKLF